MTALDLRPVFPALIVAIMGLAVLLVHAFTPKGRTAPSAALSVFGLLAALAATVLARQKCPGCVLTTGGSVVADDFSFFLHVVILTIGIFVVVVSPAYLRATGGERGEYYALVLFAIVGMLGLVCAVELISLFVALEVLSVALYALCGFQRDRILGQEAAIKYFVTGAFSSAFLLYGVALLYGASGGTSLARIAAVVASPQEGMTLLTVAGAGLLLVGLAFKVASVPFHGWAPDVYEGAPTTVTALMSAGVKVAAFGAVLRIFADALAPLGERWQPAVAVLAILTMVVGNLGALAQAGLKRMLAYSSVAHTGYVLTALVASRDTAAEAVLFYLVPYALVNLGTFGTLAVLSRDGREPASLDDLRGLAARRPALAMGLAIALVSLAGVPISGGFVGKVQLFSAAVSGGYVSLAIIGVVMSVVSAYYYLRWVVMMYMHDPKGEDAWSPIGPGPGTALALSAAGVLALGVYPGPVLALARLAARAL